MISPEARRTGSTTVQLIDGAPPPGFLMLGKVRGLSCAQRGSNPDMAAAREQLKLEAARLGGTAVASIGCEEKGLNFEDDCWKSISCEGDVGRLP